MYKHNFIINFQEKELVLWRKQVFFHIMVYKQYLGWRIMWSNFGNRFNGDCFRDLRRDFNKLMRNFKKNACKRYLVNNCYFKNALKWGAIGGILTFLIISQIGIPLAIVCIGIVAILVICNKWQ